MRTPVGVEVRTQSGAQRRPQVQDPSLAAVRVADAAERERPRRRCRLVLPVQAVGIEFDLRTEVDPHALDRTAEVSQRCMRIRAGINDDEMAHAPPHEFVDAEVLEAPAIRQVHVVPLRVEADAEHLARDEHPPPRPQRHLVI